jgi:hypothetical protein
LVYKLEGARFVQVRQDLKKNSCGSRHNPLHSERRGVSYNETVYHQAVQLYYSSGSLSIFSSRRHTQVVRRTDRAGVELPEETWVKGLSLHSASFDKLVEKSYDWIDPTCPGGTDEGAKVPEEIGAGGFAAARGRARRQ